jgi:hypothetical protein
MTTLSAAFFSDYTLKVTGASVGPCHAFGIVESALLRIWSCFSLLLLVMFDKCPNVQEIGLKTWSGANDHHAQCPPLFALSKEEHILT